MKLSLIYVSYYSETEIQASVQSLKAQALDLDMEIIVVNNAEEQVVEPISGVDHFINSGGNVGFSKANNLGAKQAKGSYLLFINPDTLFHQEGLSSAIDFLDQHPEYVALDAVQVDAQRNPMQCQQSQSSLYWEQFILPEFLLPKGKGGQTDLLFGACLLVRRQAFQAVGGWDEQFFMYAEDAQLSYQLHQLGLLKRLETFEIMHLESPNPYRVKHGSWINRFSMQIQISNLLWVRKTRGMRSLLLLYLNYTLLLPLIWIWKALQHLNPFNSGTRGFQTQRLYTKKLGILWSYFPSLILLYPRQFKIQNKENL